MRNTGIIAGLILVSACQSALQAQNAATQPASLVAPVEPAARAPATRPDYTAKEWSDTLAFVDVNAPNLAATLRNVQLPEDAPIRIKLTRFWRNYNQISQQFPELAQLQLNSFKTWDEILGLALQARRMARVPPGIQAQIHDRVAEIANLSIQERQKRVDKLQKSLDEEKKLLEDERQTEAQRIDQRTRNIIRSIGGQGSLPLPYAPPVIPPADKATAAPAH